MSRIHQMTIAQWEAAFPDEDTCKAHLTAHRWPEGVACARCGNEEVQELGFKTWHRHCAKCGAPKYRFAVIASTVFENMKVPLRHWFRAIHLLLTGKKGNGPRDPTDAGLPLLPPGLVHVPSRSCRAGG
jgi:Transposase zinc-ribbon domain